MRRSTLRRLVLLAFVFIVGASTLEAGGHTWRIKEIFSNADGKIQYIEAWESNGTPGEIGTANHNITSTTHSFTIPSNVASPTTNRSLLFATQGFADLGVVTPDYIIADNFFSVTADSISYTPLHTVTFTAGQLPTDGQLALLANLSTAVNSPQNYAGETGSVNLNTPPAVPGTGATPLTVGKSAGGTSLELAFDTASCSGNTGHQVLYGTGSTLPGTPGGSFGLSGAVCAIGGSPFVWNPAPDPSADASGVLWFVVVATNGIDLEGSWGLDGNGLERVGPGTNGSSGSCGMADKNVSNSCGH